MIQFWRYSHRTQGKIDLVEKELREKYQAFLELLAENEHALQLISELETKYYTGQVISIPYLRSTVKNLRKSVHSIISSLNRLSGDRYRSLYRIYDEVESKIRERITGKKEPLYTPVVISLRDLHKDLLDKVGGKMANLGELKNRLGISVPEGFAVTACAYQQFLEYNSLEPDIASIFADLDIDNSRNLLESEKRLKELIIESEVPPEIEYYIRRESKRIERKRKKPVRWAVRSSAIGEDLENSYAGQFSSVLNVGTEEILEKYKEIIASKYNARAIVYRRIKHVRDEDVSLSVGIMEMIHPETSGVLYTTDPLNPEANRVIINAVWGLGQLLADGVVAADTYIMSREPEPELLEKKIADKEICLLEGDKGGVCRKAITGKKCLLPCLKESMLKELVTVSLEIEQHFGSPQDIEWGIDREGNLFIFQARPLCVMETCRESLPVPSGASVLIEGAQPVSGGVGIGRVVKVSDFHELVVFPKNAILVVKKSSPRLVKVVEKAAAIVVESGNPTDHMAAIVREFKVPCVVKAPDAFSILQNGEQITVDATSGRIYKGKLVEFLKQQVRTREPVIDVKSTEGYRLLKSMVKLIAHLHLTDPREQNFKLENCRSWHDIIRFSHEASLNEMFTFDEKGELSRLKNIYRVKTYLPFELYVFDLFSDVVGLPHSSMIDAEQVKSAPFQALWTGMVRENVPWSGPRLGLSGRDFLAAVSRTATLRESTRSFAVVTAEYLNLSLRLGYHFVMVDAYLSESPFNNYVTISFKGGAAEITKRRLRVLFVGEILKRLGFRVHTSGDFLKARIKGETAQSLSEKLDVIGRMLGVTRLLDAALTNEKLVYECVDRFWNEDYGLGVIDQ